VVEQARAHDSVVGDGREHGTATGQPGRTVRRVELCQLGVVEAERRQLDRVQQAGVELRRIQPFQDGHAIVVWHVQGTCGGEPIVNYRARDEPVGQVLGDRPEQAVHSGIVRPERDRRVVRAHLMQRLHETRDNPERARILAALGTDQVLHLPRARRVSERAGRVLEHGALAFEAATRDEAKDIRAGREQRSPGRLDRWQSRLERHQLARVQEPTSAIEVEHLVERRRGRGHLACGSCAHTAQRCAAVS